MANKNPQTLELLAPARDADTAIAAIAHGADAVYIGAPAFGARAAACNSVDEISRVVQAAHPFGVKVYVTLNTILFDNELHEVEQLVKTLYSVGVDALIVQDPALLSLDIPPIDLHASTQWDSRRMDKIAHLAQAGFSQIVVPREFSLEQIRQAVEAAGSSAVEVFVHGALCVSYSGDCHAGYVLGGRSANRGECPQICRLKYNLTDADGSPIRNLPDGGPAGRYWLSLADMNRIASLTALADAGVKSFKIEGRLKSVDYVKNVTAAYSLALDRIVEESDGRYVRASYGKTEIKFEPDVSRSFNRGFTQYFLTKNDVTGITSWRTPKWIGRPVGKVTAVRDKCLQVNASADLHNGDGLGWFDASGSFTGFRVNRVDGKFVYPAPGANVPSRVGTMLYRNADAAFDAAISRDDTACRYITVDFSLNKLPDGRIALNAADDRGCNITVVSDNVFMDKARSPQAAQRSSILGRLGGTIYRLGQVNDALDDMFIPSSVMADLRRKAVDLLDSSWRIIRRKAVRRHSTLAEDALIGLTLDYHANVANSKARDFYQSHGAEVAQSALEAESQKGELRVMTTRYCIRRELGACLRTSHSKMLPAGNLYLDAPIGRLRLDFDCANCQMRVFVRK